MTEIIEKVKQHLENCGEDADCKECMFGMENCCLLAEIEKIKEELQQYRALGTPTQILERIGGLDVELGKYHCLGTVEELKEAREKQVAKKPIGRHTDYKCSVCGRRVRSGKGSSSRQRDNFCQRCGTKIDWEEGAE